VKLSYEGIDADGSRIAYSYTAHHDGKEYRAIGVGMENGWIAELGMRSPWRIDCHDDSPDHVSVA
jgi:hypothetical protein